jgi:ubiquinone/menaquinone biosynthesis C-methylase UbiE
VKVNFFNVDAERLLYENAKGEAAGYRRGAENTERRKKCLTELY